MKVKLKHCDGECQQDKPIWANKDGKRYCKECYYKLKPEPGTKSTKPVPISKQSDRRKKEDVLYSVARKVYLEQNKVCKMNILNLCTKIATTVQHKKGRGKYYLDQRYWMPACMQCHSYADTHPQEAFDNDWAIPRLTNEL